MFHGISVKPGKPTAFGVIENKPVFGMPGYPTSCLTNAYVLLAPALDFGGNRMRSLGDTGIEEWKRTGKLDVFHYAYGRMLPVHYELYADARRHNCLDAALAMPIQVFQGRRDDAVDPDVVERWSLARPNVELHMLDDDHQLAGSVGFIWEEMKRFLAL